MNPKDLIGASKPNYDCVPLPVLYEVGMAMAEGAHKYGPFNWRKDRVVISTYLSAAKRHLDAFKEGEDIDPDSQLSHISKAIAGLMVVRDAMICEMAIDDRPSSGPTGWMDAMQNMWRSLQARLKCVPRYDEHEVEE